MITEPKVRAAAGESFDSHRRRGQELDVANAIELAHPTANHGNKVSP